MRKTWFWRAAALFWLLLLPVSASAANTQITCKDANLYAAVVEALEGSVAFDTRETDLSLTIRKTEAAKVTALTLNNREISDLSGLEGFSNLQELNIANNALSDFSPLSALKHLTRLIAYGNSVEDASPLYGLTALEELSLAKNKLSDANGKPANALSRKLSGLVHLKKLDLSHNLLRYTAGLENLSNLESLNLFDNAIRELSGLSGLAKLQYLNLGENNEISITAISRLDALDGLTALKAFHFDKNNTPEIAAHVGKMTRLETLCLANNAITDVSPLAKLSQLRELVLYGNKIADIAPLFALSKLQSLNLAANGACPETLHGVVTESGALVWPNLRKLDISGDYNWNLRTQPETGLLFQMAQAGQLELAYRYDRVSDAVRHAAFDALPHVDANGTTYVTYEDFLARGEEGYDDYNAMFNAHMFANAIQCDEVRATAGKTYHIYNYYEYGVTAKTNIDWQNATFVIHDEDIEQKYGRYWPLMLIVNTEEDDIATLNAEELSALTLDRSTRQLDILQEKLAPLNAKGYRRYLCTAENNTKKQFIRFGYTNAGEFQQDRFIIDSAGNLLNDVVWNFEQVTSFEILPIPNERGYVRNATFISNAPSSGSETPSSRGGKPIYFNRNFQLRKSCNMEVSNIHHYVTSDDLCGSYHGILTFQNGADLDVHDLTLFTRRFQRSGRSTYDMVPSGCVNIRFSGIRSNDLHSTNRWGVMASDYCKDVLFEDCVMNRIDAHQGIYNLTIQDCTIGNRVLTMTGMGTLNVIRTEFIGEQLTTLRFDYGSTWRGDMYFTDCTLVYRGRYAEKIFNYDVSFDPDGTLHDFGYDCHMPNLYIDNLTIDNRDRTGDGVLRVIYNWNSEDLAKTPPSYWPREMILNGVRFINNDGLSNSPRLQLIERPAEGLDGNYIVTDVRIRLDGAEGEDITRLTRQKSAAEGAWGYAHTLLDNAQSVYETAQPVLITAAENPSTENRISLYRDGTPLFADTALSGTYQELLTEPGLYRFTVESSETQKGTSGTVSWQVRVLPGTTDTMAIQLTDASGAEIQTVTIPAVNGASILCAFYDAEEYMLDVRQVSVVENHGSVSVPDGAAVATFLLLDENAVPRSQSVTLPIART